MNRNRSRSRSILYTAIALLTIAVLSFDAGASVGPHQPANPVVNVNAAAAAQLAYLPGVGPKTAERIVADRQENGTYRMVDDLLRVRGIGPKTLQRMRPYVVLKGETTARAEIKAQGAQGAQKGGDRQ